MTLADQWRELAQALPAAWAEARVDVTFTRPADADQAAALLAPLQPLHVPGSDLALRLTLRSGGEEALRRGLGRVDQRRLPAVLSLVSSAVEQTPAAPTGPRTLAPCCLRTSR